MTDIIIPAYNAHDTLFRALCSIGDYPCHITIVDDCSDLGYDSIIQRFDGIKSISVIRTPSQIGPGAARQLGVDSTSGDFIVFLDADDTFASPYALYMMELAISESEDYGMLTSKHSDDNMNVDKNGNCVWLKSQCVSADNNRLHGKMYRRAFLEKYSLRFSSAQSDCNEDISFNKLIRMLSKQKYKNSGVVTIRQLDEVTANWRLKSESICRRNDCEFYYNQSNMGLAKNMLYVIEEARRLKICKEIITEEVLTVMMFMYQSYICTLNVRPEFADNSFAGCKLFYQNAFKKLKNDINPKQFLDSYNQMMVEAYTNSSFNSSINVLNIIEFLNLIDED